jgi:uncharacterized protein YdeI (YjbR/CyaY-like superfamily)
MMTQETMGPKLFKDRAAWRAWLARNNDKKREIWLAYYKKGTGKKSVSYEEALEEALCYGWIDSTVNKLDAERYIQRYTPRKPKSIWSASNKARIEKLIRDGRMAAPGLAAVETAKRNGAWHALDRVDIKPEIPPDLAAAIESEARAKANFELVSASQKKMFAWFIVGAKRPETRARRVARCLEMIRTGEKFGIDWRAGSPSGAPEKRRASR